MKPNLWQCRIFFLALLVSPICWAGIGDEGTLADSLVFTFLPGSGTGSAIVTSKVYQASEESNYRGFYIYTYLISDATVNLSVFSAEILPNAVIGAYGWDADGKAPLSWEPVRNSSEGPIESFDAFFNITVKPGETSATLWFISPQGPTQEDGALAGITGGSYNFLVGKILTPIPEPTTCLLLAAGGLLSRFSRKRKL
jgi:hypothetical protein